MPDHRELSCEVIETVEHRTDRGLGGGFLSKVGGFSIDTAFFSYLQRIYDVSTTYLKRIWTAKKIRLRYEKKYCIRRSDTKIQIDTFWIRPDT
jgi:hypothetical protein